MTPDEEARLKRITRPEWAADPTAADLRLVLGATGRYQRAASATFARWQADGRYSESLYEQARPSQAAPARPPGQWDERDVAASSADETAAAMHTGRLEHLGVGVRGKVPSYLARSAVTPEMESAARAVKRRQRGRWQDATAGDAA